MRTDEEILERIKEKKETDFFGFETSDLIVVLSLEHVKPFLKDPSKNKDWKADPRDRESIIKKIKDYMPFAWEKANDERGLSAGRSMAHFNSWVWLAGDDLGDLNEYKFYGKDNLVRICELYGLDHSKWDDGIRSNG